MKLSIRLQLCLLCVAVLPTIRAERIDTLRYNIEGQVSFSNGHNTPFWLVNNKQGLSSIEKNNGYLRAAMFKDIDNDQRFSWGAGVDLAGAYNFSSSFIIQQLYGELKYRCLGLLVGSKEIYGEFNNPRLSSGNLLYSGNARPIPQIRVGIPRFTIIPYTHDWLSIKGYIAYGMFTDDNWQEDFSVAGARHTKHVLYHSKGVFLKVANPDKFPAWAEGGLEMAAQFGGKVYLEDRVIDMPHKIKDWIKVFFPSGGGTDTPTEEQVNVYGNHVGSWNLLLGWNIKPDLTAKVYYQHFFEDHSMMFFDYKWKDGFWGVEIDLPRNPFVSSVVYEYLYTKDQSGPVYWDHTQAIPEQISGRDHYYNHGFYTGWQHWGMGIGNPLLISPIYNRDGIIRFCHNRIIGHHLGFMGNPIDQLQYRVLLSYTRSWGEYDIPTDKVEDNVNGLFELTYSPKKLPGASATLSFGFDGGSILGPSQGVMLTLRKTGCFSIK